jgi:hypothetical protein
LGGGGGCENTPFIRATFEFHAWVRICGLDPDGILNDAFGVVEHQVRNSPGEKAGPLHDACFKLPLNLPNIKRSSVFSPGPTNLPKSVVPVPEHTEKLIITSLFRNIKENLGYKLDTDPSTDRNLANSSSECQDFVVIGCSHAEKTANQMRKRGLQVQLIHIPNYRASAVHSGKIREALEKCTINRNTVLILQIFDNGNYMVATDEGGLIPMHKGIDDTYHAIGDLVAVPK